MHTAAFVALTIRPKIPAGTREEAPDVDAISLLCSKWPSMLIATARIAVGLGVGCPVGLVVAVIIGVLALVGFVLIVLLGLLRGRLV